MARAPTARTCPVCITSPVPLKAGTRSAQISYETTLCTASIGFPVPAVPSSGGPRASASRIPESDTHPGRGLELLHVRRCLLAGCLGVAGVGGAAVELLGLTHL